MSTPQPDPALAGGTAGPDALRPLLAVVLEALHDGAAERGGPLPAGGPEAVAARVREAAEPLFPERGTGAEEALRSLVRALAQGAADPADPLCAAHLHTPPLALAVAADLAVSALNPSMDSWDQAPAASELEAAVTRTLAVEVYPSGPDPDALVTTGGTESNQLALLLARERHGAVQVVCGAGTHHSVHRAAWLLGLPEPVTVPAPSGTLDPAALDDALTGLSGPLLVAATAGTTDTGRIDPLPEIAGLCERHGAELHVDAAYGGPLLFSASRRSLLNGLDRAHSVTVDLHKMGWQPVAAGLLAVPDRSRLAPLGHTADYLNADDDTEAGLPDLLGRSFVRHDAPTSSRSPSPSERSAAPASAHSSTAPAPPPTSSPISSRRPRSRTVRTAHALHRPVPTGRGHRRTDRPHPPHAPRRRPRRPRPGPRRGPPLAQGHPPQPPRHPR